ncbi:MULTISPECIES: hypothetical protein [Alphaproteobacteria]|uniref:hypothetical protein n=1 Tax=Sphingopyxis sp. TaxID=1908224 RepID=UPI00403411C5
MNIDAALSEPLFRLIAFHNGFNRNIKVTFGALESLTGHAAREAGGAIFTLPTGGEPWGKETRWRSLASPIKEAASFLAEIGIARATAAFEDYRTGAEAEFDRAGLAAVRPRSDGTSVLKGLDAMFGVEPADVADIARMATFFDVARNCVVHRSNRASRHLASLRADEELAATLTRWPKRAGKWNLSLPSITEGDLVDWRPRHAIMASDVYYRCAALLDRALVQAFGPEGLARMAAHWCFFADPAAPCPAKLDAGTMVRTQLAGRYKVRSTSLAGTIALLRETGTWDAIRTEFDRRYPDGPETAPAKRRRALREAKNPKSRQRPR